LLALSGTLRSDGATDDRADQSWRDAMSNDERSTLAPCGIDCSCCELFLAANDEQAAQSLVPWFRSQGWLKPNEGAAEIMQRGPYCDSCRGDQSVQWSGDCRIRECCVDRRGLNSCGDCADLPCAALITWSQEAAHHAQALNRLRSMRAGDST
jgi:hypothetical protein